MDNLKPLSKMPSEVSNTLSNIEEFDYVCNAFKEWM